MFLERLHDHGLVLRHVTSFAAFFHGWGHGSRHRGCGSGHSGARSATLGHHAHHERLLHGRAHHRASAHGCPHRSAHHAAVSFLGHAALFRHQHGCLHGLATLHDGRLFGRLAGGGKFTVSRFHRHGALHGGVARNVAAFFELQLNCRLSGHHFDHWFELAHDLLLMLE